MRRIDKNGFTLPELLAASSLITVIIVFGLILTYPRSYAVMDNNAQRYLDIAEIMQGIDEYEANTGSLPPTITKGLKIIGSGNGEVNLCPELVPKYLKKIPVDPIIGKAANCTPTGQYVTGFIIGKDGNNGSLITISALGSQGKIISLTR